MAVDLSGLSPEDLELARYLDLLEEMELIEDLGVLEVMELLAEGEEEE